MSTGTSEYLNFDYREKKCKRGDKRQLFGEWEKFKSLHNHMLKVFYIFNYYILIQKLCIDFFPLPFF